MPLSKHLWEAKVPLLVCRSIGFLGYIRLQINEHTIIESHPDNEASDLRLNSPWPSLKEHLDKVNVSELDRKSRSHVPAVVILYYFLRQFKENYDGAIPKSRAQKEELKQMIRDSALPDEHGIKMLEENFEEAIHLVNTSINPVHIPFHVQAILDDESCTNLTQNSSPFWLMCAALKEHVQAEGTLPVRGVLPDMAADTQSYVTLQQIYQKQAQTQAENVYRRVSQIARNLGLHQDLITENEVIYLIFSGNTW